MGSRTMESGSDKVDVDRCEKVVATWLPSLLVVVAAFGLSSHAIGQSQSQNQNEVDKALTEAPVVRAETETNASRFPGAEHRAGKSLRSPQLESDNLTFRPTVLVRRGTSQGSGTIIASLD